jgi:hypothetical protein
VAGAVPFVGPSPVCTTFSLYPTSVSNQDDVCRQWFCLRVDHALCDILCGVRDVLTLQLLMVHQLGHGVAGSAPLTTGCQAIGNFTCNSQGSVCWMFLFWGAVCVCMADIDMPCGVTIWWAMTQLIQPWMHILPLWSCKCYSCDSC